MIKPFVRELVSRARSARAVALTLGPRLVPERVQRFGRAGVQQVAMRFPKLGAWLRSRLAAPRPSQVAVAPRSEAGESSAIVLEDLIAQAQTGATWQARAHAVSGLATFHDPEALRVTLALLNDPSVEVATEAISTLEAYGTPAVRAELLRVLDDQGRCFHPLTRAAALLALARSDDANEQARVRDAVRDVAAEVSLAAITAIGTRRLPADLSALERVVEDASGFFVPDVRAAAQRALLGTEPPVVIGSRH